MQTVRPRHKWVTDTNLSAVVAASAAYYFWCSLCTSSEQQLACEPPPLSFTCSWSGGQQAKAAALLSIIEKVPPLKASPWNVRLDVSGFMHGRQVGPREHQNRSNKSHKKTKTRGETPSRSNMPMQRWPQQSDNTTWINRQCCVFVYVALLTWKTFQFNTDLNFRAMHRIVWMFLGKTPKRNIQVNLDINDTRNLKSHETFLHLKHPLNHSNDLAAGCVKIKFCADSFQSMRHWGVKFDFDQFVRLN